jgi:hypothetical protein
MSFDDLPREIVQRCAEYLPFEVVSGDLKAVSKATRGVARRALTCGRWRPIRYVAAEALGAIEESTNARPPDAVCAPCQEAWALDPKLVIRVIYGWDTRSVGFGMDPASSFYDGIYQGRFLSIVEPSVDGLSRIVSALEDTYLIQFREGLYAGRSFFPFKMLARLAWHQVPTFAEAMPLVGRGLEAWADQQLAVLFLRVYLEKCWYIHDAGTFCLVAQDFPANWEDRMKANAFIAEMGRMYDAW